MQRFGGGGGPIQSVVASSKEKGQKDVLFPLHQERVTKLTRYPLVDFEDTLLHKHTPISNEVKTL